MNVASIHAATSVTPGDKPGNLKEAAEAFEALFIGQMLKTARESGGGGLGENDQAGASMLEVAEEHLAREMTRNGGVGLARMILAQMSDRSGPAPQAVSDSDASGLSLTSSVRSGGTD